MKNAIFLFALVFFNVLLARAQEPETGSLDALSDKYGFRDAHFESAPSDFRGLVLISSEKQSKSYYRPTDSKKIGGAEVNNIRYIFYKGKLESIAISTKGITNSRALLDALIAQYGEAEQPNEYIKKYYWSATRVIMAYDENSITNDAIVLISSKPMAWQKKEDSATAAKKAASDL